MTTKYVTVAEAISAHRRLMAECADHSAHPIENVAARAARRRIIERLTRQRDDMAAAAAVTVEEVRAIADAEDIARLRKENHKLREENARLREVGR